MEKLFGEIISVINSLIPTCFKNDSLLAKYAKLSPSDLSKIRNYEKYPDRYNEDELNQLLERFKTLKKRFDSDAIALRLEYYVFYSYNLIKEEIEKHLFVMEYDELDNLRSARLIEIDTQLYKEHCNFRGTSSIKHKDIDIYKTAIWEGNGVSHIAALFLNLSKKNVIKGEVKGEIQTASQIVLYVGIGEKPGELVKGSYSSTSEAGFPTAALCVLRRLGKAQTILMSEIALIPEREQEKILELLKEVNYTGNAHRKSDTNNKEINHYSIEVIDNVIALELRNKKEETSIEGLYGDIDDFKKFNLYQRLHDKIAGYYELYQFSPNEAYIGRSSLYIKKDGSILLTTKLRSYTGEIHMHDSRNFFRIEVCYEHNRQNHYELILNAEKFEDQTYLIGYFSGFGNKPEGGALFLKKSLIDESQMRFEDFIKENNKLFFLDKDKIECAELLRNKKMRDHFSTIAPLKEVNLFQGCVDESTKTKKPIRA